MAYYVRSLSIGMCLLLVFALAASAHATELPASYDLRDYSRVPSGVPEQGGCNSGWAFATMTSVQSVLLPSESVNYSANNLINNHLWNLGPCDGGNYNMATSYFARWAGPVNEADDPYGPSASAPGLTVQKHIQQAAIIPDKDIQAIKQAVSEHGAVATQAKTPGIWNSETSSWDIDATYFSVANASYYYDGAEGPDHAVAIIGWDDEFPSTSFTIPPPGNGAFLVRNSFTDGLGNAGDYWVSYYDAWVGTGNYQFIMGPADDYMKAYAYDPLGWTESLDLGSNSAYFANLFTADTSEPVNAVGFYATVPGETYEINIYTDVTAGNPASGTLASTTTGAFQHAGYYVIPLSQPAQVTYGKAFSVVVHATAASPAALVPIESKTGITSLATSAAGQSFISTDGSTWTDIGGGTDQANACVKALASYQPNIAPEVVHLDPFDFSSKAYSERCFQTSYNDANGYSDLASVMFRTSADAAGSIFVQYDLETNVLKLMNNAGTSPVGNCQPGQSKVLSNSQGILNCALATVFKSGNDFQISICVAPTLAYASATPRDIYLQALDKSGASSGWVDKGNWTIEQNHYPTFGLTPTVVTSHYDVPQSLSAVYSDEEGAGDIYTAYIRVGYISTLYSLDARYSSDMNQLALLNDAGTSWGASVCHPGEAKTLSNSQGTLNCAATTVTASGNDLTINWNFTPKLAYVSTYPKNVFLQAVDRAFATNPVAMIANNSDTMLDMGDWTITSPNIAPFVPTGVFLPVTSQPDVAQNFSGIYYDFNGYMDLKQVYIRIHSNVNGIQAYYDRSLNRISLVADSGSGTVGYCTPGVAGILENSQGSINCALTTVSGSGTRLNVGWNITPKAAFQSSTGRKIYYMAKDMVGNTSPFEYKGDWIIISSVAPTVVSLTPSSVNGTPYVAQNFTAVYSDLNGYQDLKIVYIRVNSNINGIKVYYNQTVNKIYLTADSGTGTVGNCTPGAAVTLTNSQGSVNCAQTTVSGAGTTLTVNWNITPNPSSQVWNIYLLSQDMANYNSAWILKGTWKLFVNQGPTITSLSPSVLNSPAGMPQSLVAAYSDPNGYADIKKASLRVYGAVGGFNVYYARASGKLYLLSDAGNFWIGPCTAGIPGTLENSQGILDCGATTVSGNGNNLTISWRITPKTAFASLSAKDIYLSVADNSNASQGYTDKGDWTITAGP